MALIPLDPIVSQTPQADISCSSPNPAKTVPPGSEDGRQRVDDPKSFATAIEEALRRILVPGRELIATNGMAAPPSSPVEPTQQDTDLFFPPSPVAETSRTDEAELAGSVSTPETSSPQALPAFPAWVPVEPAAEELSPTPPTQTSAGSAASAAKSPEPRAESLPLDQGGETQVRLAAPAAEVPVFHLPGSAPETQGRETHASSGPQAQAAETAPSDPSLLPADSDGHFSPDAGDPRLSVPADDPGTPGNRPFPHRPLTVSFTMISDTPQQEPATRPQNSNSAATAAQAAAEEPNRSRPAEGNTPKVPAQAALPQQDDAQGLFPAVAAAGKTGNAASDTAPKAKTPAGPPSEPLPAGEDPQATFDPEQAADEPPQDGPAADKTGAPRTAPDAAPSARLLFQGRQRPVSPPGLAGSAETDPLQQAGVKPAEGRTEIPGGPGRSAAQPGPWRSDSVASHLQIHAREALESSAKQFHLRIQGDGLGSMRWEVRLEPGKIAAQALVDTIRLQELVQGQQDALVQRFQELGLEVEHFEVLVDSGSTGERFQGGQNPEPGEGARPGLAQPSPARASSLPSPGTGRGLDLFV